MEVCMETPVMQEITMASKFTLVSSHVLSVSSWVSSGFFKVLSTAKTLKMDWLCTKLPVSVNG